MESENSLGWIRLLEAQQGPKSCAFVTDVTSTSEGKIAVCGYEMAALKGSVTLSDGTGEGTDSARSFVCVLNGEGEALWSKRIGGLDPSRTLSADIPMTVGADSYGSLYVTGCFDRRVNFNPAGVGYSDGPATAGTLSSFLLKLDNNGDFQWVVTISAADTASHPPRILADVNAQGDVYLLGSASDLTLRSSLGWQAQIAGNQRTLFKLDRQGHELWKVTWANGEARFTSMNCTNGGPIYITGSLNGDFDFDPGDHDVIPSCNGQNNGFLMRISSDASFDWVKTWGRGSAGGQSLAVSAQGTVYVVGWIGRSSALIRAMNPPQEPFPCDVHLQCYRADGSLLWERSWGEYALLDRPAISYADGNVFLYGWYKGRLDTGPENQSRLFNLKGYEKSFYLWGFDEKGNTILSRTWEPVPGVSQATGMDIDDAGNIFLTGGGVWKSFVIKLESSELPNGKNQ